MLRVNWEYLEERLEVEIPYRIRDDIERLTPLDAAAALAYIYSSIGGASMVREALDFAQER